MTENPIATIPKMECTKFTVMESVNHFHFKSSRIMINEAIEITGTKIIRGLGNFLFSAALTY